MNTKNGGKANNSETGCGENGEREHFVVNAGTPPIKIHEVVSDLAIADLERRSKVAQTADELREINAELQGHIDATNAYTERLNARLRELASEALKRKARDYTRQAVKKLLAETKAGNLRAANLILDAGWGPKKLTFAFILRHPIRAYRVWKLRRQVRG